MRCVEVATAKTQGYGSTSMRVGPGTGDGREENTYRGGAVGATARNATTPARGRSRRALAAWVYRLPPAVSAVSADLAAPQTRQTIAETGEDTQ